MHAFFITRGNLKDVELVTDFLRTRVFLLECTTTEGKKVHVPLSGLLQPIQLWSYVFPKEYKEHVFTALKFDEAERYVPDNFKNKMALSALRMMLGADPIEAFSPKPPGTGLYMPVEALRGVQITPIGQKEDVDVVEPDGLKHEGI